MSSDSDDDLLALAGQGPDVTTSDISVPSKRKWDKSSDDDGNFEPRSRRKGLDDESSSEGESLDQVPYPLEGKFKNIEDRAYIMGLPEMERESLLFDRSQEMQLFEERRYLADRLKQREQTQKEAMAGSAAASAKSRAKATAEGNEKAKMSRLQELKKRKEAKARRGARSGDSDYSNDEDSGAEQDDDRSSGDSAEESDYGYSDDESYDRRGSRKTDRDEPEEPERELVAGDLNRIKFGKSLLAKYCYYPLFEEAAIGAFVRVNIGFNPYKQVNVYRVCQIKRVATSETPYKLNETRVDISLVVSHAGSERTINMDICSDKPITEDEFKYWSNAMRSAKQTIPSSRRAALKAEAVQRLQNTPLSSAEIEEIVEKRQNLNGSTGAQVVVEKSRLLQELDVAQQEEDAVRIQELETKLAELNQSSLGRDDGHLARLLKVNQRNRKSNIAEVRKAEAKAQQDRRKSANQHKVDPFSRLRTTARTYYDSAKDDKAAEIVQASALSESQQRIPVSKLTSIIAGLDIDLDPSIGVAVI